VTAALLVRWAAVFGLRRAAYRHVYLRSAHWQRVASSCRRRQRGRCAACGRRAKLDVHHCTYARLGREREGDIVGLCRRDHRALHAS